MRRWRTALVGVLGAAALGVSAVQACSVDGVPSLSVNGRLVTVNKVLTGSGAVDSWTPFVARGTYTAHHVLLLREDRVKVAQALPPEVFRFPWRWHFGDGATARGMAARHVYARSGSYVVSVEAYLVAGTQKQWFTFDKATIQIQVR